MSERDIAFEMATSNLRVGAGVTREIGMDLAEIQSQRVLVFTDPRMRNLAPMAKVEESLCEQRIHFEVFDQVRVEPNDRSFQEAIGVARSTDFDAYVAVGGGSVIDTAKACNLYATYPAEFLNYVNAPLGKGQPVPGPLKPLIAVPTTAGTGSETTGVAIFDMSEIHAKTGIAHRRLKPTLGLVDADNTRTMPPLVAASTGLDVLCHAIESYTALPYSQRPLPERPVLRPAYQGSNPISDIWSTRAIQMVAEYLFTAFQDPSNDEARSQMLLASSFAGMGFGNAGVHLCHGMSYPISSMVRDFHPAGYPDDHPLVPYGISVVLTAPAVFRFTGPTCPERHMEAARLMGADTANVDLADAGELLASELIKLMRQLNLPNGLAAIGFTEADIPALVAGTLPQHRVTKLSPRPAGEPELSQLFHECLKIW